MKRAWFSAGMLARFCGLSSMEEIRIEGFQGEEVKIMKKALYLKW